MLTIETRYEHVILDEKKRPMIAGTKMKIVELVLDHIAYGWSPEELHFQHPDISLGQIHSALAYYWDHQPEMDEQIQNDLKEVDELKRNTPRAPLLDRLKKQGLI